MSPCNGGPVPWAEFTDILGNMLHACGIFSCPDGLQMTTHAGCWAHFTAICVVPGERKVSFLFHVYILKEEMTKKIR